MMRKRTIFMSLAVLLCAALLCACTGSGADGKTTAETATEEETTAGMTWQDYYDLGVRYVSDGNYQEAVLAFTSAIEIDPRRPSAYVGRGGAYVRSGETAENLAAAQADYEAAVALDDTLAEAYLGLADVYIRQGDYDRALEILRQGLEKTGENREISDKIDEIDAGNISDSSGNVRRTTGYDGGGAIQYWHDFTYNARGQQDSVTSYDAAGNQTGHLDLTYNEAGQPLLSYSSMGNTGEVVRIAHTYDADGNQITTDCYDLDGSLMQTDTCTYNSAGQMTRRDTTFPGEAGRYVLYEYDAQGYQTKCSYYAEDGTLESYEVLTYDGGKRCTGFECYNGDGELETYMVFRYDEQGNHIGSDYYDGAGNLTFSEVYD